ncbi:putative glycosylphosphatidylinositol anchor biosynthesis protein [Metschnikowia bicuspidata var. bicuspidata NRRL YB-4993]|uniref:Glycosylphosphatidylinositol anchor biosynthesis protein 11 n=1 Tax=Metschnikowia bicuspidata var. bicuspidata NRRL YB-4993 TaxID=869754 RepID=A0A1A0HE28_9ASCO|nr:putative glycosylphosphatidylinositol anchor biosynthesis protein [Metschnikowia bicuspidata var. bicuspidata NRRL YB-4993]OBA22235.1 putative glycosylphosphatidylinositol anchor biosynthesis protein [Metschnikowia bicuspidata var. bicuspidata NRRL YB-4993]
MRRRSIKKTVSFQTQVPGTTDGQIPEPGVLEGSVSIFAVPIHLLLLLHSLFSSGLTENPTQMMAKGLVNLVGMQILYGFWIVYFEKPSIKSKNKATSKGSAGSNIVLVLSCIAISVLLANITFVALILLGAPMHGFLKETYLLACHASVIVVHPILILFRLDLNQLGLIFKNEQVFRRIFRNQTLSASFVAILGAWIGVIPIPLDWDRPWQQWPITILSGVYVGSFAGSLTSVFL